MGLLSAEEVVPLGVRIVPALDVHKGVLRNDLLLDGRREELFCPLASPANRGLCQALGLQVNSEVVGITGGNLVESLGLAEELYQT